MGSCELCVKVFRVVQERAILSVCWSWRTTGYGPTLSIKPSTRSGIKSSHCQFESDSFLWSCSNPILLLILHDVCSFRTNGGKKPQKTGA